MIQISALFPFFQHSFQFLYEVYNNDPQIGGDGFFDFVPEITVVQQSGKIIFTKAEPFGEFLFESLRLDISEDYNGDQNSLNDYNLNQKKYVYHTLYNSTKTAAEQERHSKEYGLISLIMILQNCLILENLEKIMEN